MHRQVVLAPGQEMAAGSAGARTCADAQQIASTHSGCRPTISALHAQHTAHRPLLRCREVSAKTAQTFAACSTALTATQDRALSPRMAR